MQEHRGTLQADISDSKRSQQCGLQANEHMIFKETPVGIQAQRKPDEACKPPPPPLTVFRSRFRTQFMFSTNLLFCPKDCKKVQFAASKRYDKSNTHPGKQGVEAMDLLPFSDISVILSDTFQCELLHQVNFIRFLQMGSLKKKK